MKKTLLFTLILSITISFAQKKKDFLKKFDKTGMETSILYQPSPLIDIQKYTQNPINIYAFYQVYKDVFQFDTQQRFPSLELLKTKTKNSHIDNIIPLAIIHSDYETLKKDAFVNHTLTQDNEGFLIRNNTSEPIFEKHTITVASALRLRKKGLRTIYKLASEDIYNTTNNTIANIVIDFGDGNGFQKISENKNIEINYLEAGIKELTFKLTFANGIIKTTHATIDIRYDRSDSQRLFNQAINTITASITPDLSVYGEATSYPGEAEYEIFMSTEAGAFLDKPLIIIDGFDPTDGRPITGFTDATTGNYVPGIYDLLDFTDSSGNTSNLGDMVRAEGFDVVVLNFPEYTRAADGALIDGGSDFIERNAMILVELINTLNAQKIGNEQNVIIGPSMGGLISRYALNYMENQSMSHDTRLWLSFDSPHHGANVPIGFQHQFNFLAYGLNDFTFIGNQNVVELQVIVDGMLKSAAARQMLVDQFEPHLSAGSAVDFDSAKKLPLKHAFSDIFYNRLNALTPSGYPENLRKIAMINGSGINARYQDINGVDLLPARRIVNTTFNVAAGTDITLSINFTPLAGAEINVSHVYLDFAWWVPAFDVTSNARSIAHSYSDGVDAASGGLFDIGGLTANLGTTGTVGNFLAALETDYFNFIPSVSAMALEVTNNEINWYHTPTNLVTARAINNITPFDAWYMPDANEPHVTLTQGNVDFAWNEIVLAVLNTPDTTISEGISIANNPMKNTLTLLNKEISAENLHVSIYDTTGKKVFEYSEKSPSNTIKIPLQLTAGIYITHITTNTFSLQKKIIIE